MQAYNRGFARVYNQLWANFSKQASPRIQEFYESTSIGEVNRKILDLCCGTGQLAAHFLEEGYQVVGLDLSEHMLQLARENARLFIMEGKANFIQADATQFALDESFGLVVCLYDSLNHLEDEKSLFRCFQSVYAVLVEGGYFIFDVNTALGLQRWNGVQVRDEEDVFMITRGIYEPGGKRAWTKITGFMLDNGGSYERFEQTAYNTVFDLEAVRSYLLEAGFEYVQTSRIQDLSKSLEEPEREGRVFYVVHK